MGRVKKANGYEREIKAMIVDRLGRFDVWLSPLVEAAASNRVLLAKIQKELEAENSLLLSSVGVGGQVKQDSHPLLKQYNELQRTLLLQYEALGLSYKSTPSKIKDSVKSGGEEHDKLSNLLNDIQNV